MEKSKFFDEIRLKFRQNFDFVESEKWTYVETLATVHKVTPPSM
jgi:hypothetical protein